MVLFYVFPTFGENLGNPVSKKVSIRLLCGNNPVNHGINGSFRSRIRRMMQCAGSAFRFVPHRQAAGLAVRNEQVFSSAGSAAVYFTEVVSVDERRFLRRAMHVRSFCGRGVAMAGGLLELALPTSFATLFLPYTAGHDKAQRGQPRLLRHQGRGVHHGHGVPHHLPGVRAELCGSG